ncbi:uncharacterized protein LOC107882742 [Acyrthosiphon pisum]|uniref:Uncharacterized protein n=1 Tax=Acyrthosiphon pisum TaxID=7029 RepID=A0A8R2H769_ACYPI|nr:uncharacterized protein LOC107882742 [Acyrthosiphon pisum]|eukprot:XP_016657068.1 PREDICTED: uncharacterized protein LOC107882742 [Acyrthosiphon pisum]
MEEYKEFLESEYGASVQRMISNNEHSDSEIDDSDVDPDFISQLIVDDKIILKIFEETNLYAQQKLSLSQYSTNSRLSKWTNTNLEEMHNWLRLILWMGLVQLPEITAAYKYVRQVSNKCLPHPSTLRKWYAVVDGAPGFTKGSINAIQIKVAEMKLKDKTLVCGMMIDEISIKEGTHFNGTRNQGYISYGTGLNADTDTLPLAKEAIVIMLVALNSNWLFSAKSGSEKANLINIALVIVYDTGVLVKTLTFDVAASNISMATSLGAKLYPPDMKTFFSHPKIFIFLDPCHMLKLCRKTFGDWKTLYDKDGREIKWELLKQIIDLQESAQLHLATKIRPRHINYYKEKMKVKLAAQTLSESVAKALTYCTE